MNLRKIDFVGLQKKKIKSIEGLIGYISYCKEKSRPFDGKCLTKKFSEALGKGVDFSFKFNLGVIFYEVKFINLKDMTYTLENGGGSIYVDSNNTSFRTSAIDMQNRRFSHSMFEIECDEQIKELTERKEAIKATIDSLDYFLEKAEEINKQLEELDKMPIAIKDYIRKGTYGYKLYIGIHE